MTQPLTPNEETHAAWEANAAFWDARMAEGNDFANLLLWPAIQRLLEPQPGQQVLDAACGNGLFSRKLARLGAQVTAFDFSVELIRLAKGRTGPEDGHIEYLVLDATDAAELMRLGERAFDACLCNMALFDIAEIGPLFRALRRLLRPGGKFVFSLMHPAFNNPSSVLTGEEADREGQIVTTYSVKTSRYMTPFQAHGLAMRSQPKAQLYFHRPIQDYLNLGFVNGFVLDGFEERAFPPEHAFGHPLSWGGTFSEIPPVLMARLRLKE